MGSGPVDVVISGWYLKDAKGDHGSRGNDRVGQGLGSGRPGPSPIIMVLACTVVGGQSTRVGVAFRCKRRGGRDEAGCVPSTDRRGRSGRSHAMTVARYFLAAVLILVALGPITAGACVWRRRILPRLSGPPAVVTIIVLATSAVVVVTELLGTVHAFYRFPVAISLAVVGTFAWWLARREGPTSRVEIGDALAAHPVADIGVGGRILAIVATSILVAEWATRTVDALRHGMTTVDTLWYHLPFAARFVQEGSLTNLHYVDTEPVVPFYPATSELLHALGIQWFGNDLLSPLLSLGWMALVLLAAWCIGRPFGVAPVALVAATVLLGTPGLVATQPGGGYTDVVGIALFLVSLAILVNAERVDGELTMGGIGAAALAAGLAFGSKFTLVGPVIILTVGVVVVGAKGRRIRTACLWVGLAALTGSFWYIRNWVRVGNPLPSLSHLGPLSLPSPPITSPNTTFGHYLFNVPVWRHFFLPGFRSSLGPAWPAILLAAAAGLVFVTFSGRTKVWRMTAVIGVGSVVAFVYTPQFLGVPGAPFYFVYNLRYAAPALLLGLVMLPIVPALSRGRRPLWLGLALLAMLGVTQIDSTIWPLNLFSERFAQPVRGVDSLVGLLIGVVALGVGLAFVAVRRRAPFQWLRPVPLVIVAALVLVLGYPLQQFYMSHRYQSIGAGSVVAPKTVTWAQGLENTRIALSGPFMILQYPYYGKDLTNYVQYVAKVSPNGGEADYSNCRQWVRALHAGHYKYLITTSSADKRWMQADPDATLYRTESLSGYLLDVFKLKPTLSLSGCNRANSSH
jgi:hypothetical protein